MNRVLGVSTNGAAPPISGLSISPVDARTDAIQMSFSMDAPGVACRLWYMVLPLRDTDLLEVDQMSAWEVVEAARPDSVINLPQASTVFNKDPLCLLVEWSHHFLLCVENVVVELEDNFSWVTPPIWSSN